MIVLDINWRISYANPAASLALGRNPGELLGRDCADCFPPDSLFGTRNREALAQQCLSAARNSESLVFEEFRPGPRNQWFEYRIHPAQGSLFIILRDITEDKNRELDPCPVPEGESILLCCKSLSDALENSFSGTWEWDLRTGRNIWSSQLWHLYGLEPNSCEPSLAAWLKSAHPEDRGRLENSARQTARTGCEFHAEWRVLGGNGAERWLKSWGRPVRSVSGKPERIIGMVLDITAQKKTEAALRETEERLRLVLAISPDIVCFKDGQGRWLEANDADLQLFGLVGVDYRGKTDRELGAFSPFFRDVFNVCEETDEVTWRARKLVRSEEAIPLEGGAEIVLDLYKIPLFHANGKRRGLLVLGRDITARKRAEIELQRSHDLLERRVKDRTAELEAANASLCALGDNLPDVAIYQFERSGDDDGRYTYVSRGFERIRGISLTELVKDGKILNLMHPDDLPLFRRAEKESAKTLAIYDFEGRVVMPSGELKYVRWRAAPRVLENGNILWEGFMTDVTKRKLAEMALYDAHQALLVIKECGEAIARAENEAQLLNNVCKTVLKIGTTRLAWIGFPEEDPKKSVRLVAHAGEDISYVKKLRVTWADGPRGQGPVGTAVRECKTVIFDDLQKDPRFIPWQEEARKRGYASMISLPLIADKSCIGVLSIYSAQANRFTAEKVELLQQLAGDISHGILALRSQADRERLEKELLNISEREKQLIAQELHDGLCQHLAGAALMGNLLQRRLAEEGNKEADYANEICSVLATGLAEARNLSHGLHPIRSACDGLMESLAQLAQTATRLFHTSCSFVCDEEAIVENPEAVTHLFRIAQEALTNAMKHGQATKVRLSLRKSSGSITLSIEDNGIGIPKDRSFTRGLGLRIMDHRAKSIGATLKIRRPGRKGTVVSCRLPVAESPKA